MDDKVMESFVTAAKLVINELPAEQPFDNLAYVLNGLLQFVYSQQKQIESLERVVQQLSDIHP